MNAKEALKMGFFLVALVALTLGILFKALGNVSASKDSIAAIYEDRVEHTQSATVGLPPFNKQVKRNK